jgi:hypothetical protein
MTEFLNKYMGSHRSLSENESDQLRQTFEGTVNVILESIGPKAFRLAGDRVNAALLDSLMVGVALRLRAGPITDPTALRQAYESLITKTDYLGALERSTANEESVSTRLTLARDAVAKLP